jgi:hypothetical protein
VWQPVFNQGLLEPGYSVGSVTLDRRVGRALLTLGGTRLSEERTVLGGRFSTSFGSGAAVSWFADAGAALALGRGWSLAGSYRLGWTALGRGGGLAQGGRLATDAWSFDIGRRDALVAGDRLAIRLMQPLRVRAGGYNLLVPVSYDYATLQPGYGERFFNLAPTGREVDLEAAYGVRLLGGELSANAFARRQPGHIAALGPDLGGALRFSRSF